MDSEADTNAGFVIERWIFHYSIRNGFKIILKEYEALFRNFSVPDYELSIFSLKCIVDGCDFKNFDLIAPLIDRLEGSCKMFKNQADLKRLRFLSQFLFLLYQIGHSSTKLITDLLDEYFGSYTTANQFKNENEKFNQTLIQANFTECRKFILNLLMRRDRQAHFRDKKFPFNFTDIKTEVKSAVNRLTENLASQLPPCDLESFLAGRQVVEAHDPSVLLFSEYLRPFGQQIDENFLCIFLKNVCCSQISVSPPEIALNLAPEFRDTQSQRSQFANVRPPIRPQIEEAYILLEASNISNKPLPSTCPSHCNKCGSDELFSSGGTSTGESGSPRKNASQPAGKV